LLFVLCLKRTNRSKNGVAIRAVKIRKCVIENYILLSFLDANEERSILQGAKERFRYGKNGLIHFFHT
jgi:hypothetical protein